MRAGPWLVGWAGLVAQARGRARSADQVGQRQAAGWPTGRKGKEEAESKQASWAFGLERERQEFSFSF